MATGDETVFCTNSPLMVPSGKMTRAALEQQQRSAHVEHDATEGIKFVTEGWYEVLLRVDWDPAQTIGTRFAHTKIPGRSRCIPRRSTHSSLLRSLVDGSYCAETACSARTGPPACSSRCGTTPIAQST